jgi:hypothetical protein
MRFMLNLYEGYLRMYVAVYVCVYICKVLKYRVIQNALILTLIYCIKSICREDIYCFI